MPAVSGPVKNLSIMKISAPGNSAHLQYSHRIQLTISSNTCWPELSLHGLLPTLGFFGVPSATFVSLPLILALVQHLGNRVEGPENRFKF